MAKIVKQAELVLKKARELEALAKEEKRARPGAEDVYTKLYDKLRTAELTLLDEVHKLALLVD